MCYEESKNEWCGILFYTMEGSLEDPNNLKFDVRGLYPMHIGTSGGTTIEDYEEVLDYFDEYPEMEAENIRHGFIHSHNSMDTFFSGTDKKQLEDGAQDYDLFLSVITNNAQDYVGMVSFRYEEEISQKILGFDFGFRETESGVGTLKCKIRYEMCANESEFFENRVKELREKKRTTYTTSHWNGHKNRGSNYYKDKTWNPKTQQWELDDDSKNDDSKDETQKDLFEGKNDKTLWEDATEQYPPDDFPVIYSGGVDSKRPFLAASYLLKRVLREFYLSPKDAIANNINGVRKQVAEAFSMFSDRRHRLFYTTGQNNPKKAGDRIIEEMNETGYGYQEILGGIITIDTILRKDIAIENGEKTLMADTLNLFGYLYGEYTLRVDVEILEEEGKELEGPSDLQLVNGNEEE